MTVKNNRCDELGVCQCLLGSDTNCQGQLGSDPKKHDCDSWECNVLVEELHHQPGRRATDRAPQPTYPFAPGVIQGPRDTPLSVTLEDDGFWHASWQRELLAVLLLLVLCALLGDAVARWLV